MSNNNGISRRNVLKTAGGSLTALGVTGLAAASPGDTVEVNVGYSAASGRQETLASAETVVRDFDSLDVVTIRAAKQAVTGLDARGDVRYVEENGTVEALAETLPWNIDRIDADVAHANGYTGEGADIAIIDTGIDDDHPDIMDHLGKGKAFATCDTSGECRFGAKPADNTCNYAWTDDDNHGTHCAGIAAGDDNTEGIVGVAPDATIHAVKVLDKCGSGSWSDVAAGIEYVADMGWDVANLSLGGSSGSSALKDACEYAYDKGVFLAAAAGNDGPCSDCVGYPAAYSECVAVSSTNSSDGLSSFSSTGPEVELAAPGTDIYSIIADNAGYDTFSGTSMACPHVAGAAGLLMAEGYSNTQARDQLCSTAENVGLASNEQGCGLLDVAASFGLNSGDN